MYKPKQMLSVVLQSTLIVGVLLWNNCQQIQSVTAPTSEPREEMSLGKLAFAVNQTLDVPWRIVFNHSYNRMDTLKMDVFEPFNGNNKKPAIVFLGGGGSIQVNKGGYVNFRAYLAGLGYWVTSIECRVTSPDSLHRCVIDNGADFASAVSWVRENADSLGIDENMVAGVGSSMGASCAMAAAYVDTSILLDETVPFNWKPNYVVSFSGTLTWGSIHPQCNWLQEIESGEPLTRMIIGRQDPLWEIQAETFKAANKVGVASGKILNKGHGIGDMGEIWSAEVTANFLSKMWGL